MIDGGYILQPRTIKNSEVAHLSPCTREVWAFLLREARYEDNGVLKRGQLFIKIDDIREALHWRVGYRKEMYSRKSVDDAMKVLRRWEMIVTTKVVRGLVVTICKYDYYQDKRNYEGIHEGSDEGEAKGVSIYKERKKENKKELEPDLFPSSGTENEISKKKKKVNLVSDDKYEKFIRWFNKSIGEKKGKPGRYMPLAGKQYEQFKKLNSVYRENAGESIGIAMKNALNDPWHVESGYKWLTPEFFTRQDKFERFLNM